MIILQVEMNRKTIIYCCVVVAVLLAAAVCGFFLLFSDNGGGLPKVREKEELPAAFKAIPSDAVMILEFENYRQASDLFSREGIPPRVFSSAGGIPDILRLLPGKLDDVSERLSQAGVVISLHYSGHNRISPLAVIALDDMALADRISDAVSEISGTHDVVHTAQGMVLITDSEVLAQSSLRHIAENVSVMDNPDFSDMAMASSEGVNLYVNHQNLGKLFSGCFNGGYLGYASFFQNFAGWSRYTVESVGEGSIDIGGFNMHSVAVDEYSHVFDGLSPKAPGLFSVTPYYASMAISVPVPDLDKTVSNMDRYRDGQGGLDKLEGRRRDLQERAGISPLQWASALAVEEAGIIRFESGGEEMFVNMVRCGNPGAISDSSGLTEYAYEGFLSSLFGSAFSFADEDCCASVSGWIVIGPERAVRDFTDGRALELNLARYMSDAGLSRAFPSKSLLSAYVNMSSDPEGLTAPFREPLAGNVARASSGHTIDMYLYSLVYSRGDVVPRLSVRLSDYEIPTVSRFERDTVVEIPKGPWKVKNSGTGRTNLMYQQDNMYICLTEENGKGIWSAPFSTPICGNIDQVDYFENGKLQMIFASGSKLYLIDRLGRMVNPFPVDLGKDILLGPKAYDFNQNRKYNVMVLHTDNTLGLYDLKGRLRDDWTGFDTDETIKSLPELLEVNASLYWVVTTSLQTVICDFTGRPVADFSGSKKLRPGAEIRPYSGDSVEIETYDGKTWLLNLKSGGFSKR